MGGATIGMAAGSLGGGTISFCVVLPRQDVTGVGLVETDFTAEPRFVITFRALAKDPFFTGTVDVAECNLALPAVTTATFPQPVLPTAPAATLVRLPSATRFFGCCAAIRPAGLAPPAFSAMAGRFAVAVAADDDKRREAAAVLDIDEAGELAATAKQRPLAEL